LDAEGLAAKTFEQPVIDEAFFPAGVNGEVVTPLRDGHVHMRVFERGVGETRSCGTGTVAAATAALADAAVDHTTTPHGTV
ncbi:diaminopimelate epimerase, partial [Salmonella enterica subsp. enterica serovar Typhimurium]|nr:diaminopimelate epimerase [Salmonella enterica subsp. enterica serovar Typhimurium]